MYSQEKKLAKNRRGRPATGKGKTIGVRLHDDNILAVDEWIAAHPAPKPSRPEAIRGLIKKSLQEDV